MKTFEEFDNLIKQKLDAEQAYPFTEDKWARMEEMLDQADAQKKRRRFLWIFFAGFFTATALITPIGWWYYYKNVKADESTQQIEKEENKNINKLVETKKEINTVPIETASNQTTEAVAATTDQPTTDAQPATIIETPIEKTNKLVKPSQKATGQRTKKLKDVVNPQVTDLFPVTVAPQVAENPKTDENKTPPVNKESKATTSTIPMDSLGVADVETKNTGENSTTNQITPSAVVIQDSVVKADSAAREVLAADVAPVPPPVPPVSFLRHTDGWHLSLQAGGAFNLGLQPANQLADGRSFVPCGGLTLSWSSRKAWSFQTGLLYTGSDKLSFSKQVTMRTYDFGYHDQILQLTQKRLHYFMLPLEAGYVLHHRLKITTGVHLGYLFRVAGELKTTTETSLRTLETTTQKVHTYVDGLQKFDTQLNLGVEMLLLPKISLRLEGFYSLLDLRQSSWTGNTDREHQKGARFILKYQIK